MSPTTDNFIHSLVEMSKAFEELPTVKQELDEAKATNDKVLTHVAGLESNIIGYKEQIEALNAKVRSVEAERDDAELRFLEADEKAGKVSKLLRSALSEVDHALVIVDPPKPMPEPIPTPTQDQSVVDPTQANATTTSEPVSTAQGDTHYSGQSEHLPIMDQHVPIGIGMEPVASGSEGQRAPLDPTASFEAGDGASQGNVLQTDATSAASASGQETPTSTPPYDLRPYTGKRWSEVQPRVWDQQAWLDGGGSMEGWHAQ